jgi:hypothetical protein
MTCSSSKATHQLQLLTLLLLLLLLLLLMSRVKNLSSLHEPACCAAL